LTHRLGNLFQTNFAVWLTALVAAGAVFGAGFAVRSIADREDRMREAQTSLAELSNLATGLRAQAEAARATLEEEARMVAANIRSQVLRR